eukprot:s4382_g10.t1
MKTMQQFLLEFKNVQKKFNLLYKKNLPPIKPGYNLRRVLTKLPGLVESGDITKAKKLLLGMHERPWHSPISDFTNLLRRSGQPTEVIQLVREAVLSCAICASTFGCPIDHNYGPGVPTPSNQVIQIDLFKVDDRGHLIMIDEATRFKLCDVVEGQESEQLLQCLMRNWIYMFPPEKVTIDQQMSLMGHETGAEFERLGMKRNHKGTTAGQGAEQRTGTGIAERHVQLLKLTMYKLRAELSRQFKVLSMNLKIYAEKLPWLTTSRCPTVSLHLQCLFWAFCLEDSMKLRAVASFQPLEPVTLTSHPLRRRSESAKWLWPRHNRLS